LGLPLLDAFIARADEQEIAFIPYGDAPRVLGALVAQPADSMPVKS